jgi:hypothetical protein
MRCACCGWIVSRSRCPCGKAAGNAQVPVGTAVVARGGRGPSMNRWDPGEVMAHCGRLHQVAAGSIRVWCEIDDLVPAWPERDLAVGNRVWARWLDGLWYPGAIDAAEGPLRHVAWDDGDQMWLEPQYMVTMAVEAEAPEVGISVMARRWNGEYEAAVVEEKTGARFRVRFISDGEAATLSGDELYTFPPNPFADPRSS